MAAPGEQEHQRMPGGERAPSPRGEGAPAPGAADDEGAHRAPRPTGEQRTEEARAALAPLGPDERPRALRVAVAVSALLAAGVIAGALSVHDLNRHGGSLPGAIFIAVVLALLARGMYERRYWAVLGFEALLAFQIIVTSLALVVATTVTAAAICFAGMVLGGWLFWKLVRVMGRIQAGERGPGAYPD